MTGWDEWDYHCGVCGWTSIALCQLVTIGINSPEVARVRVGTGSNLAMCVSSKVGPAGISTGDADGTERSCASYMLMLMEVGV